MSNRKETIKAKTFFINMKYLQLSVREQTINVITKRVNNEKAL